MHIQLIDFQLRQNLKEPLLSRGTKNKWVSITTCSEAVELIASGIMDTAILGGYWTGLWKTNLSGKLNVANMCHKELMSHKLLESIWENTSESTLYLF